MIQVSDTPPIDHLVMRQFVSTSESLPVTGVTLQYTCLRATTGFRGRKNPSGLPVQIVTPHPWRLQYLILPKTHFPKNPPCHSSSI